MLKGYVYYGSEPVGRHFAPQLTPKQMLVLGVFGGKYVTDSRGEFPASWFAHAELCPDRHDPSLYYSGVNASQSLADWRRKGWIHPVARHVSAIYKHCAKGDLDCRRWQRQAVLRWAYDRRAI